MASSITQLDVARACGVTRTAVAYTLNPRLRSKVSPEVRQRVMEAVQALGYRPDRQAQLMRGLKSGIIGVIHSAGIVQIASQRVYEVGESIHSAGYQMLGSDAIVYREDVAVATQVMLDSRVEGVVLITPSAWFPPNEIQRLQAAKIPVVAIAGMQFEGIPQVIADGEQGTADLTRHLLAIGHRHLVMLTHSGGDWTVKSRVDSFLAAIRAAGGEILPTSNQDRGTERPSVATSQGITGQVILSDAPANWRDPYEVGYIAMDTFIQQRRHALPDVVLCSNDDWAIGALTACAKAGIRVPRDLAITGYDNAVHAAYGSIPLTTVAQPLRSMSQQIVSTLVDIIQGRQTMEQAGRTIVQVPCEVVVRDSCGATLRRGPREGSTAEGGGE